MGKYPINRRAFLRCSLTALAGALLAGCQKGQGTPAVAQPAENYYLRNEKKILEDTRQMISAIRDTSAVEFDEKTASELVLQTEKTFKDSLADLPFIGGGANELTANLYQSALALAFYRAMKAKGNNVEITGKILYHAVEKMVTSNPLVMLGGRLANSKMAHDQFRSEAEVSHKRAFAGDWVFDFIPGDGAQFDFGIDYLECGICKYYAAQNAEELTPYLCLLDFPISAAQNSGLARSSTLAHGAARCDFRYKMGRPVQMEWQPDFLKGAG